MSMLTKYMPFAWLRHSPLRVILIIVLISIVSMAIFYGETRHPSPKMRTVTINEINKPMERFNICNNKGVISYNDTPSKPTGSSKLVVPKKEAPTSNTRSVIMQERLNHVRDKCSNYSKIPYWQNLQQGGQIWSYGDLNYCIIPKVGCTFWKRIMRFVSKDYPRNEDVYKPSDIDRTFVHYGGLVNIQRRPANNPIVRSLVSNKVFMFSRDPYTRLWSAYIDKFLLPDFWRTDALNIVKKLRPNASQYELQCANNLTFHEFLTFVNLTSKGAMNEHWERVHRLCSPCHIAFDVIGKLETFAADSEYIMDKNDAKYLQENTTRLDMVTEEVKTLTKYNFNLETAIRKGCFEKLDVAERLWKTFQYNGYIHRDIEFPKTKLQSNDFLTNPIDFFTDIVLQVIHEQTEKGIETKSQKREMMIDAYKKVPSKLLKSISDVYKYDFELFGYDVKLLP